MSQNEAILEHLKREPITAMDALRFYGCFRLASRINDLRGMGHDIETRHRRMNGKIFAEYHLKGENNGL